MIRGDNWDRFSVHHVFGPVGGDDEPSNELDSLVVPSHPSNCPCWDRSQGHDGPGAALGDEGRGVGGGAVLDGSVLSKGAPSSQFRGPG